MSDIPNRPRQTADREEPDQWLIDAARRAGHRLSDGPRSRGTTAWRVLLNAGLSDQEVLRLACTASGTEPADFTHLSPALGTLLPQRVAVEHKIVPLGVHKGALAVATTNPLNPVLERELAFAAKQRVRLHAANPSDIMRAQAIVYGAAFGSRPDSGIFPAIPSAPAHSATKPEPAHVDRLSLTSMPAITRDVAPQPPRPLPAAARPAASPPSAATPSPLPAAAAVPTAAAAGTLADRLLTAATVERASEAILEPQSDGSLLVRLRIDGTRHDRFRIAAAHTAPLIQTLKTRARLDPAQTRNPQQGCTMLESTTGPLSLRVSTEPTTSGHERVVLRLFSPSRLLPIDQLGFSATEQHRLKRLLRARDGLIIVAGPANAGKTTTLYAIARELRGQARMVASIEEPVEYPLEQVTQIQLSDSPHLTLAAALRAVIRANSDSIILGAPLDAATLEQATAKEGVSRLVVASVDSTDIMSTLKRLTGLHPDGAPLASALQGIVVQRLVRRLCSACALPQLESELPELQQKLLYGLPTSKVRRPVGCPTCHTTGYLGRMAIAQVVPMMAPLREAMSRGAGAPELEQVMREAGVPSLWDSGMHHVLEGTTSLAELLDTVPPPETGDAAPQEDIDALLAQLLGGPRSAAKAAPRAAPAARAATVAPNRGAPAPAQTPAPRALRVLLVDDDATARRALARELSATGITVLQAADGVAGLEFARRLRPDVVLTEVALPRLDAIGMLGALAGESMRSAVVVLTAQADDALVAWLHEAGACGVLPRDMPTPELVARLQALAPAR